MKKLLFFFIGKFPVLSPYRLIIEKNKFFNRIITIYNENFPESFKSNYELTLDIFQLINNYLSILTSNPIFFNKNRSIPITITTSKIHRIFKPKNAIKTPNLPQIRELQIKTSQRT